MRKKLFFLFFFSLFCFSFQKHVRGMEASFKPGELREIPDEVKAYGILAFLPFGEDFFEYVAKLHRGVPKRVLWFDLPEWLAEGKKCSFVELLAGSCSERPMRFEVYRDKEAIEKDDFCVKRSSEWFWGNFERVRELLNGVLSNTVLVLHYRRLNPLGLDEIKKISCIENLKGIDLSNSKLNDKMSFDCEYSPVKDLGRIKNLRLLSLRMTIFENSLQGITENIEALCLAGSCCIGGLGFLDRFKKLKALDLSGVFLDDEAANFLANSKRLQQNLQELRLRGQAEYYIVSSFYFLARFEALRSLDLSYTGIKTRELCAIADSNKLQETLRELDLTGCKDIDNFAGLALFKKLRELILSATKIKERELIFVVGSNKRSSNSIRVLKFDRCEFLSKSVLFWSRTDFRLMIDFRY